MMGERSSPFVSGIAVLLICAALLRFSASQTTTCTMPSVEEGQATTLTVEFGFNLQDEKHHRDVIIKHQRGTTGKPKELLDCYWEKTIKDYRCKVNNHRFYFNDHITEKMTLLLPHASKEDEGKYFIDVTSSKRSFCYFSLGASQCKPGQKIGRVAALTCNLGSSIQDENQPSDVIVKRLKNADNPEELLDCYLEKSKDYRCKVKQPSFYFNDHITENMTLFLDDADTEDEEEYYCDVTGKKITRCKLTRSGVDERSDEDGSNWKADDCSSPKAGVIAAIVVCLVLVLVLVVAGICLIKKRRRKRSTRNNGVNNALARLLPCWSREEAKEPVQATDLGKKDSKYGEEENPEGKDATQTVELHELLDVRDEEQGSPEDKKVVEA